MAGAGEVLLTPPPAPPGPRARGARGPVFDFAQVHLPLPQSASPLRRGRIPALASARSCPLPWARRRAARLLHARALHAHGDEPQMCPPVPRRDRCWSHRVPFPPPHRADTPPAVSRTRPCTPGHVLARRDTLAPHPQCIPLPSALGAGPPSAPQGYALWWGWGRWELVPSSPASSSSPQRCRGPILHVPRPQSASDAALACGGGGAEHEAVSPHPAALSPRGLSHPTDAVPGVKLFVGVLVLSPGARSVLGGSRTPRPLLASAAGAQ